MAARVMEVSIETFTNKAVYTVRAYRKDLPTFLINAHSIRYYSFPTIEGVQEVFLYSDIRHISFREIDA